VRQQAASAGARVLQPRATDLTFVWGVFQLGRAAESGSNAWSSTRAAIEQVMRQIPRLSWTRIADLFRSEDRFGGSTHPEAFGLSPIQPTASSPRSPMPSRCRIKDAQPHRQAHGTTSEA